MASSIGQLINCDLNACEEILFDKEGVDRTRAKSLLPIALLASVLHSPHHVACLLCNLHRPLHIRAVNSNGILIFTKF